jgi:hypothetical protein
MPSGALSWLLLPGGWRTVETVYLLEALDEQVGVVRGGTTRGDEAEVEPAVSGQERDQHV